MVKNYLSFFAFLLLQSVCVSALVNSPSTKKILPSLKVTLVNDYPKPTCCGMPGTIIIQDNNRFITLHPGEGVTIVLPTDTLKIFKPITNMCATDVFYIYDVTCVLHHTTQAPQSLFISLRPLMSDASDHYSINIDDYLTFIINCTVSELPSK